MQDSPLRTNMLKLAEDSVLDLLKEIDNMLTALRHYIHTSEAKTESDRYVRTSIASVAVSLRSLPYMLGDMVSRWKTNSPQILSKSGLEIEVLNETMATLSATFCFILSRNISPGEFKLSVAKQAHLNLVTCNKLLTEA